jgi:hypothetical protein
VLCPAPADGILGGAAPTLLDAGATEPLFPPDVAGLGEPAGSKVLGFTAPEVKFVKILP